MIGRALIRPGSGIEESTSALGSATSWLHRPLLRRAMQRAAAFGSEQLGVLVLRGLGTCIRGRRPRIQGCGSLLHPARQKAHRIPPGPLGSGAPQSRCAPLRTPTMLETERLCRRPNRHPRRATRLPEARRDLTLCSCRSREIPPFRARRGTPSTLDRLAFPISRDSELIFETAAHVRRQARGRKTARLSLRACCARAPLSSESCLPASAISHISTHSLSTSL